MKTMITKTAIMAALSLIIIGTSCKKEELRNVAQNPSETSSSLSGKPDPATGFDPDLNIAAGRMVVYLRDIGQAGFGSINLSFTGVALHYLDTRVGTNGWVYLEHKPQTLDVLQYQNGSGLILATRKNLPVGAITGIRVLYGSPNYVVWGDTQGKYKSDLVFAKGVETMEVPVELRVENRRTSVLALAFNADKSISQDATTDRYVIRPLIYQTTQVFPDVNPQ
jgi:hypothetical protein